MADQTKIDLGKFRFWTFPDQTTLQRATEFFSSKYPSNLLAAFRHDYTGYCLGIFLKEDQTLASEDETTLASLGGEFHPLTIENLKEKEGLMLYIFQRMMRSS